MNIMEASYLKKLTVTGIHKKSEINFNKGLNIITGPSNVGKTCIVKCIDYLTGSSSLPFSTSTHYNTITLEISVNDSLVILSRNLEEDTIIVESTLPSILSGEYYSKNKSKNKEPISNVWLRIFGITPPVTVVKNKNFKTQKLGVRTFINSWIIHENDMNRPTSILLPQMPNQRTAYLSALLYLLYGKDFSEIKKQESAEERKIRHDSVKNYISSKIVQFNEHHNRLAKELDQKSVIDIETEIDQLSEKLHNLRNTLNSTNSKHENLLQQIAKIDSELSEKSVLLNRFNELSSQYQSDFNRLSFIVESHNELANVADSALCPICNNHINQDSLEHHLDSFSEELTTLISKIETLNETNTDLQQNISVLLESKTNLEQQKKMVSAEIDNILLPDEKKLSYRIQQYKSHIKTKSDIETINKLVENWSQDIDDLENEKSEKVEYIPKDEYPAQFWQYMTKNVQSILAECAFDKASFSRFDRKEFDIMLMNEKKIARYGKGFIAYLNTVVVLALRKIFSQQSQYKPFFYIFDTPLLGLDEGEKNDTPESMQIALFEYFKSSAYEGQLIVIENSRNLPKLNYNDINYIEFTKSHSYGRYGFLNGVNDD